MFEQPETPSQPASSTASEDVPTTTVTPPLKTVEEWAAEKKTKPHLFAAARAAYNWPVGRELRGEEYDKAITSISTARIGYSRKKV